MPPDIQVFCLCMAAEPLTQTSLLGLWAFLSPDAANGLFLLDPAQLAFRNEPALAAYCAQDPAFGNFLAKAFEHGVLRLVRAQIYRGQLSHLLTLSIPGLPGLGQKNPADVHALS